ncbi:hypothetical protein AKJ16_DCAP18375 [Drosera capensis]
MAMKHLILEALTAAISNIQEFGRMRGVELNMEKDKKPAKGENELVFLGPPRIGNPYSSKTMNLFVKEFGHLWTPYS